MVADDRFRRVKDLTQRALDLPEAERVGFLVRACGGDTELLHEVQRLLEFDVSGTGSPSSLTPLDLQSLAGHSIGPYRIVERIGEGGMGIVFLAVQTEPLRRKVALKVIKLGMDTDEVIRRFDNERQALALMDHPNVARVLDAGATESGRPYFVMEYIAGSPLTRYCQENRLDLRQRLRLFIDVCRGVQHAHQKGLIHRDLKPDNVLVTEVEGRPVPKIIDFGVTKATGMHRAARTFFTQVGRVIGTPEYMSPEQADLGHQDTDTRSDVFSLGVVLYELLTGMLPVDRNDLIRAGWGRMGAFLRDEVPAKPSTRVTSTRLVADPVIQPRAWARHLRGDLDWITMKALEREKERRYRSADDLADDLTRHLRDQPVLAGPPSRTYRVRKFARRNRALASVTLALLVAIVGVAFWQSLQARIIATERDRAVANHRLALAQGQLAGDPTVAVAYALSSLEIVDQPATRDVIRRAHAQGPLRDEMPRWHGVGNPIGCDASPDGRYCAVTWSQADSATIGIYDLLDYSMRLLVAPTKGTVFTVRFNANASHVVANGESYGADMHVWRVADGEHLWHVSRFAADQSSMMYPHPDPSKMLVASASIGMRTGWFELDLDTGEVVGLGRSRGGARNTNEVHAPAIDADATWILDFDGETILRQRFEDLDTEDAVVVGRHDHPIASVALNRDATRGASVCTGGQVKVWDLAARPPRLVRTYTQEPGQYWMEFDPRSQRFFTSWGSSTVGVFDLSPAPPRKPVYLGDRSHWPHDGAFLPDGALLTSRNGVASGPLALWSTETPIAWSIDLQGEIERGQDFLLSGDGGLLITWLRNGEIHGIPLTESRQRDAGLLAKTDGWIAGGLARLRFDEQNGRLITDNNQGQQKLVDLQSGAIQVIPRFAANQHLVDVSPGGRFGCFIYPDDTMTVRIVDLENREVTATTTLAWDSSLPRFEFIDDTTLAVLESDRFITCDLSSATAPAEVVWTGDASNGGRAFEDGKILIVRDGSYRLWRTDLVNGRRELIGTTPRGHLNAIAHDTDLGLLAVGGWWDTIEVFDLRSDARWRLPALGEGRQRIGGLWLDPHGRWLLANSGDGVVAWRLPLDPLYSELSHRDLLARVRELTNVRVVPEPGRHSGFRITSTTLQELE